ncbi:MAG TPA: hypothetical protein VMX38_05650 [Verrucomicrobiae bacterium]|jgi:hypothetical protein|nr:hypothetical protein [Verrucomicrobiae bacterium]
MSKIYLTGGRLRSTIFRKLEEWQSTDQACIIEIDPEKNQSRTCVEYTSPQEACADELPAILFKSASVRENKLYACTSTEVLIYELPNFQLLHYISLPCFNDLHHVCPSSRGTILVVVTGLDLVVEITTTGQLVREWSVLGEDTWARFSRQIDYRKVPTTKPHKSHPNHAFELNGDVWVTRLRQQDAVCLTTPGPRIDVAVQRPHDGFLFGEKIYFTTVDGHVVIAGQESLLVEQVVDLNAMTKSDQTLGWCRGVLPLDQCRMWVGFTRVRPTKFVENVSWIRHGAHLHRPSHIALYDVESKKCEQEIEIEPHGIGVVFSLLSIPQIA